MKTVGTISVAEGYLSALHAAGIRYVFVNSGSDFPPIIEAMVRMQQAGKKAPEFVVVPHENVALCMAQGYSKTSGEPSCAMVHVNVGTANTVCAMMNAARDNVPVLLAAGRTPLTESGHAGSRDRIIHWMQENFDQAAIVRESVKWEYELRHGQPVGSIVQRAVDVAMQEPRGPVYLTLPRETLMDEIAEEPFVPRPASSSTAPAVPALDALEKAADLIANAQMPLIIAGRACTTARSFEALGKLALDAAIPVTSGVHPNIASDHPMNLGPVTAKLLQAADVIVVLESSVPWMPHHMRPNADAKIIHIAHDPLYTTYPLRSFPSSLTIAGDPGAAIELLDGLLAARLRNKSAVVDARRKTISDIHMDIVNLRKATIESLRHKAPISPALVADALNQVRDKNAIVVDELGSGYHYLDMHRHDGFITGSSGGLGMALGQAIGAKLADRSRQVISTMGDGSYMFGVPLAAHYVERAHKLPTLTIVLNNSQWNAVARGVTALYPAGEAVKQNEMPLVSLSPSPDFEMVTQSCGGHGARVEDPADLVPAIEKALQANADGRQATLNVISGLRVST
jgi:acetolactate synthase-1/2/3 large subunit